MEVKQYRQSAANAGARASQNLEIRAEHLDNSEEEEGAQPWSSHPNASYSDNDEAPGQLKPSGESLIPHLKTLQVLTPSYLAGFHSSQTVLKAPNTDTRCCPGLSSSSLFQGILPLPQPLPAHQLHISPPLPRYSTLYPLTLSWSLPPESACPQGIPDDSYFPVLLLSIYLCT